MERKKIAVLPGDGVGKEVIEACMIVLDKLNLPFEYTYGEVGWEFWKKEGDALPQRTIELLKNSDACLFGAITSKPKDEAARELAPELQGKGYEYRSPIVRLRQLFNLHTNFRPCKAYKGNPLNYRDNIDIVVFRENTEDLYAGVEFRPMPDEVRRVVAKYNKAFEKYVSTPPMELAVSFRIITRNGAYAIIKDAFEYARKAGRKKVTLVEKPNVIRETSGLMIEVGREIAREYPEIQYEEANIDAICMWLIKNPEAYDIIVTSNMFGDILSDLCAQLVGGLGFSPSGNLGDKLALFEPTHGSAPKYAGLYKVNPIAMILTAKLMLDWLGFTDEAKRIENGVAEIIAEGKVRTYDMGGTDSTLDMARAIADRV
ncbi:MAG: isocitrate/isopropylmalate dehydrogenase family protein [bacterium]